MLRRNVPLRRVTPLRAVSKLRRYDDGQLPQAARAKVLDRELYGCAYCGAGPSMVAHRGLRLEIHHRLPRARGGTHDVRNLIVLCGFGNTAGCHALMDQDRAEAVRRGFVIPTGGDPATTPMQLWDGRWVLLDQHGQYLRVEDAA